MTKPTPYVQRYGVGIQTAQNAFRGKKGEKQAKAYLTIRGVYSKDILVWENR